MIDFRIRSNNDNDSGIVIKYEEYLQRLKKNEALNSSDLYSYFAKDFFHDGTIDKFLFSSNLRNVSFKISCPNIQLYKKEKWNYIDPIWFTCQFEGIAIFGLEAGKLDDYNNPLADVGNKILFLESEINTLDDEIARCKSMYHEDFNSIIVKTLPVIRNFYLVFRQITVTAEDGASFANMRKDKLFQVPLFKTGQ